MSKTFNWYQSHFNFNMIIAAVDVSGSTGNEDYAQFYKDTIFQVLNLVNPPIRVIYWNHLVQKDVVFHKVTNSVSMFYSRGGTRPYSFVECLPTDESIELYIFTDGMIFDDDVNVCRSFLKERNIQFTKLHLYYIGIEYRMNLKFTSLFEGIPQTLHINEKYVGCVEPTLINFDDIDYNYIMKNDTFKATIMAQINSAHVDTAELKNQVNLLNSRILKEYFQDKLSIQKFYTERDVEGCISYVKKHSYSADKAQFQTKMSEIFKLFDPNISTYSLEHFKPTAPHTLTCQNDEEENGEIAEEDEPLDCNYLTCEILLQKCNLACIPIKMCTDDIWLDKKIIRNPFLLLESKPLIQRIVSRVEPYVMDYKHVYKRLQNPDISPFSRDTLQGVYLLHNDSINMQEMIKHNNYVLSTLFQNRLPGKPVLWHMIFLYIVAMKRFSDKKDLFFKEIQLLGQQDQYFISLVPHLNPCIIETLNCCFWYIAHVCHKAFPNSKKNVLRTQDFISGVFLKFYKTVYEADYSYPPDMPVWQLWHKLHRDRTAIFPILSHYFQHEKVRGLEKDFQIVLYKEMKPVDSKPPKEFKFLSQLKLEQVLDTYAKSLKASTYFVDLKTIIPRNITLYDEEEESKDDMLSHVRINPKTCHPYVTCPITGKYWRDCIGKYDQIKRSYVRLFKRFCEKYEKYPENSDELLCFLNMYVFQHKETVPEVFDLSVKKQMNTVLEIFKTVVYTYSCKDYLKCSNEKSAETLRKSYESVSYQFLEKLKNLLFSLWEKKNYS